MMHCDPQQFCSTCPQVHICERSENDRGDIENSRVIQELVAEFGMSLFEAKLFATYGQPLRGTA